MKVAALYRYPVKSLRGTALQQTDVEHIGFAGDRRWMVVNDQGRCQTIREHPVMTQIAVGLADDGVTLSHPSADTVFVPVPDAAARRMWVTVWGDMLEASVAPQAGPFLSKVMGFDARLVYMANVNSRPVDPEYALPDDRTSFADGFPVLLTTVASLGDYNSRLAQPLGMDRFRPNIVIDGVEPWAEDKWLIIEIGSVRFRIVKPCGRCVIITRDALTGEQTDGLAPLATLSSFHRSAAGKPIFGQNLIPDATGRIAVGDPITVVRSGPSNLF